MWHFLWHFHLFGTSIWHITFQCLCGFETSIWHIVRFCANPLFCVVVVRPTKFSFCFYLSLSTCHIIGPLGCGYALQAITRLAQYQGQAHYVRAYGTLDTEHSGERFLRRRSPPRERASLSLRQSSWSSCSISSLIWSFVTLLLSPYGTTSTLSPTLLSTISSASGKD